MNTSRSQNPSRWRRAFTLIELLTAVTVLTMMMVVILSMVAQISDVWRKSSQKIDAFQGARQGFELMTRHISQATLNNYLDYNDPQNPEYYVRKSELRYMSGQAGANSMPGPSGSGQYVFFVAPANRTQDSSTYGGMESLLNVCGYYVTFSNPSNVPAFIQNATGFQNHYRFRLMQLIAPTEAVGASGGVYPKPAPSSQAAWTAWLQNTSWIPDLITYVSQNGAPPSPVADNIIALIIRPQDPTNSSSPDLNTGGTDYTYDTGWNAYTLNPSTNQQYITANQLPPVIQITMIAIDENSAKRLENGSSVPSAISEALSGKFTTAANYSTDLASVEASLTQSRIQYRVFNSAVPILESKWTK